MNATQERQLLPEKLSSGQVLCFTSGLRAAVTRTSKRNDYDETLYRLTYQRQIAGGWIMPAVTSSQLYTVEELGELGAQL